MIDYLLQFPLLVILNKTKKGSALFINVLFQKTNYNEESNTSFFI